jgi:hypothetical protein
VFLFNIDPMKKYLLIFGVFVAMVVSCKSKKDAASSSTTASTAIVQAVVAGTTSGTVSHKYNSTGCSTVIIVKQEEGEDITLIPKDKLTKEFDVDGMNILFNYHTLRMPQPQGCTVGMPAEVTDISKK